MRLSRVYAGVALAYSVGVAAGLAVPWEGLIKLLASGAPDIWRLSRVELAAFIYAHNALAALIIYALSIIYIGVLGVLFNGYILGVVARYAVGERGFTVLQFLAAILPHGVIEIPALLLASAAGVLTLHDVREKGFQGASRGFKLLLAALLLLAPAAFIESFITPEVARAVGAPIPGV